VKEVVGVGEEERIVDDGMEWQRQRWCVLVGEGTDYKMTCCWLVSDKTRGSSSEYSFFCCCANFFFSLGKGSIFSALIEGFF
jgi:hypothetical protein